MTDSQPGAPGALPGSWFWRRKIAAYLLVSAAAILPYLSTIDDYFVRDDFGVVQLLEKKPAFYFPRWFTSTWMDDIWGYTPDEVRPFPAVSYQLTALGGPASPEPHHVLNILIHAANGVLVVALAQAAGYLSLPAATLAGLVFVLLPVHAESVAWITGRVDSMPAFFYLASFLAYVRWRTTGRRATYVWSLVWFFVALFTKQNTITMVGTLAAYDVIVRRQSLWPIPRFIGPYIPFAAMTAGYLGLRYALFGQVAREGVLNARAVRDFGALVDRHLTHVVTGVLDGPQLVTAIVLAIVAAAWLFVTMRRVSEKPVASMILYFGPVWGVLGVAPIAVAGYHSPRHVYLAAVGWAMVIAILFEAAWVARASSRWRNAVAALAVMVVGVYAVLLAGAVHEWNTIAAVSQKVVRDVRAEALAAPQGALIIVGAPGRSWDWALPFSVRPPYVRTDLTERVFIVSPRGLNCCTAPWFEETRRKLRSWAASGSRDTAVALRWDPDTGALSKATSRELPELPVITRSLLDLSQPDDLDRNLRRMVDVIPGGAR